MTDNTLTYQWTGINQQGNHVKGVITVANSKEAQTELKKMGIEVISLEQKRQLALMKRKKEIKNRDVLLFIRYLSTLLAAGMPILQGLDVIAHDQENESMKSLIGSIRGDISGGKTLAEAFNKYPKVFSELQCNLIKAGEKSGTLDKILKRLEIYLDKSENLKRKIKKALIYPIAVVSVALVVSLILLIFVVPRFQEMFQSFNAKLPFFTLMIVHLSEFLRSYWWLIIIAIAGGIAWFRYAIKKYETVQDKIDQWTLRIFVVGPVLKKAIIARYTRTLAITLEAGMPIVEAMNSMTNIMGNHIYSNAIVKICNSVVSGNQLSTSMNETKLFPNMVIQMISVGEASGSLPTMLNKIADHYEEDVNAIVDNLSTIMEPLIMAVLGIIIGCFIVAMYLPIFRIGSLF